ncbi:MAG: hypothetical protein NT002_14125 [candidate division Zixibacteria bacterium]|nr:hypothetical protein [candidate division Zixibacteria bacterium]
MPDLMQWFARNVVFPTEAIWIGSTAPAHLRELEKTQFLPAGDLAELRFRRLKSILKHAYENCSFYTERFNRYQFNPGRLQSPDDILVLPVLTKKDIQENKEQIRARNYSDAMLVPNKTGGSTGSPLFFYLDKDRRFSREAATIRHNRWTGWDLGTQTAFLWGHRGDHSGMDKWKAKLRNKFLDRNIPLDTSSITKEKLAAFRERLKKLRPPIYIAYSNSIFLYARYLTGTGQSDYHRPKAIITTAEILAPEQRELIEMTFECRVFDRYGSRETSVIATECERHTGLHICAETFWVEFLKENKPAQPGEFGKVIITDLLNYGMPFIRYQIEDAGVPSAEECSCGRGLPLMKMAAGRMTDFLVTPDGKIISGAALTIYLIANAPGVAQAQLIQEKKDEILFKIVKGETFGDQTLRFFETEIPKFFGPAVKYSLEFVDHIPLESSGKYRFSISRIDPAEMF